MAPRTASADPDRRMEELAARQHGIVTTAQLYDAGLTRRMVQRRAGAGRLVRMYRGVYRVGPIVAPRSGEMAAVLAVGEGACLSHRAAARIWGLLPERVGRDEHEVLVERRGVRQPPGGGFRVCYTVSLPARDRARRLGIPVTTAERTLLDLAALASRVRATPTPRRTVTRRDLERAVATAEREGRAGLDALRDRVEASPRRAGTRLLREILELDGGPAFTRSAAEAQLLELIRGAGIPVPEANVRVGRFELDMYWRGERVAVEVDGYRFHRGQGHFEVDRARDSDLAARGIQVVRFTAKRIHDQPLPVIAELAQVLGGRAQRRDMR